MRTRTLVLGVWPSRRPYGLVTSAGQKLDERAGGAIAMAAHRTRSAMNSANGTMFRSILARSSAARYAVRSSTRITIHR